MEINITLGSGKKVMAEVNGKTIITDQSIASGGENSAPTPFDLFLASIGTCTGIYVKSFCIQREISTEGISLKQIMKYDQTTKLISEITVEINLPANFPEKYKESLINAANLCTVKKHLHTPPLINVITQVL
jgi:ribosomal protein S12 methylthiotransferase accessory factor